MALSTYVIPSLPVTYGNESFGTRVMYEWYSVLLRAMIWVSWNTSARRSSGESLFMHIICNCFVSFPESPFVQANNRKAIAHSIVKQSDFFMLIFYPPK
jgi:hypothetical protein